MKACILFENFFLIPLSCFSCFLKLHCFNYILSSKLFLVACVNLTIYQGWLFSLAIHFLKKPPAERLSFGHCEATTSFSHHHRCSRFFYLVRASTFFFHLAIFVISIPMLLFFRCSCATVEHSHTHLEKDSLTPLQVTVVF